MERDERVKEMREVWGGTKYCLAISSSSFHSVKGFDETMGSSYMDVDMSMRVKEKSGGKKRTIYISEIEVSVVGTHLPEDDSLNGDFSQNEEIKNDNKAFNERWVDKVAPEMMKKWKNQDTSISWVMDCGMGGVLGFTMEAVNAIMGLREESRVRVINDAGRCRSEMASIGFPSSIIKTIDILSHLEDKPSPILQWVVVMHRDPGRYDTSYAFNPPDLLVGRSMFETSSIPPDWVPLTLSVDYIWVPSLFNVLSFSAGGVNSSKLRIVPESIDLSHFNPHTTPLKPSSSSSSSFKSFGMTAPETLPDPGAFNFLSIFKWEERKNWRTLFQAFYEEFATKEDSKKVRLYVRSSMDAQNEKQFMDWKRAFLDSSSSLKEDDLPKIIFLDRFVSYKKMPMLYKAASAYVTATHGEGWGLPVMEAMAMELPVIASNFSGLTQFINSDTAVLVPVNSTENAANGQMAAAGGGGNQRWASILVSDLRSSLRSVFSDPSSASILGKRARQHLLDHFSSKKQAETIMSLISSAAPSFHHFRNFRRAHASPPFSHYGSRYGGNLHQNGASGGSTWQSNSRAGLDKYGLSLNRGRVTD